jgi:hypothetical protein
VLWERAVALRTADQSWLEVATKIAKQANWPALLGEPADYNLSLVPGSLRERFKRLAATGSHTRSVERLRAKAIKVINRTQVYVPGDGMTLWQYFLPESNVLINKGSLAQKTARKTPAPTPTKPPPKKPNSMPPPPSPMRPAATATLEELLRRSSTTATPPSRSLEDCMSGAVAANTEATEAVGLRA